MNCDVIRDLLPSYADGICSPASQTLVQEHLAQCPACQRTLEQMQSPQAVPAAPRAKNPLGLLRRRHLIALLLAIVLTAAAVVTAYQVVLNVGAVQDLFFPAQWARVEDAADWTPVQVETGAFLILDSRFYDRAVTNSADSDCAAQLRILDEDGALVAETDTIAPGTSAQLSALERDTPYRVEVRAGAGSVILNFH